MTESLADALPRKMAEIRDVYIPAYQAIGPAGAFGVAMMRASLDRAARALASGDVLEVIAAYRDLEEYKL